MTKNNKPGRRWEDFLKYAKIFSPSRKEQLETIISLIPADLNEAFVVIDLGCGGGDLSVKILKKFPNARVVAIDTTKYMLAAAKKNLSAFKERVKTKKFNLKDKKWLSEIPDKVRCFVSSIALHHLTSEEKRRLFKEMYKKLDDNGAVLIADIVEPITDKAKDYFGKSWDKIVKQQSKEKTGLIDAYNYFKTIEWNYYTWTKPDKEDTPSQLFEQLKWLEEAGFSKVDCFWMRAGHAIFGGYK